MENFTFHERCMWAKCWRENRSVSFFCRLSLWRVAEISKYGFCMEQNTHYTHCPLLNYLFFIYFIAIVIKLSYTLFLPIGTLLIAKILYNYVFEWEILILVVLSYCGVSNMVPRRPLFYSFLFKYYFAYYLFVFHLFYSYCYQIIICTFYSCCGEIVV